MQEIIKIQKSEGGKDIVSARELYENLGLDLSHWSKWYKKNIESNGFAIENVDYIVLAPSAKTSEGGRPTKDFAITLDFAKRLSMMTRTAKGEEIRNYFIECEKLANEPQQPKELSRKDLALMIIQAEEENEKLQAQVKKLEPKAEYLDTVLKSVDSLTTTSIAFELGMTAQGLNKELVARKIQRKIDNHYVLTANYVNKGYAVNRTHTVIGRDNVVHTKQLLVWTEYGKAFIHSLFNKNLSFSKASTSVVSTTYRQSSLALAQ